jgi:hypothetical protein
MAVNGDLSGDNPTAQWVSRLDGFTAVNDPEDAQ